MKINTNKKIGEKIRTAVSGGKVRAMLTRIIVVLSVLAVVLGTVCLVLYLQMRHVTVEVGQELKASDILKSDDAVFGDGFDPDSLNHAGVYIFTVSSGEKTVDVRLKVVDTHAPDVTVKDVYIAIGGAMPTAEDFIESVYEPDHFKGEILSEIPVMKSPGKYPMKVRYTDASGNKTKIFDVNMILIYDSVAPTVEVASDVFVYVGDSIAYRSVIKTSDNCIGEIELNIDEQELNLQAVGEYNVKVVAVDAVGNKSSVAVIKVHVLDRGDIREELNKKIKSAADKIIDDEMTAEQKCRAVYDYIQDKIEYSPMTYRSDEPLAAYNALFVTGEGDCYSYFAAAKAFFDYLGIESYSVERARGYTDDTHFWLLVNIGEGGEERWYHFDATEMREEYAINSCLLTDSQIEAYGQMRPYFYEYDKSKYPSVESKIITQNQSLNRYIGQ